MVRLTDRLDMIVAVDWGVKPKNNNKNIIKGLDVSRETSLMVDLMLDLDKSVISCK